MAGGPIFWESGKHTMMCVAMSPRGVIKTRFRTSSPLFGENGLLSQLLPRNRQHPRTLSTTESHVSSVGHQRAGLQRDRGPSATLFSVHPLEVPRASASCNIFGVSSSFPALRQEMQKCTVRKTEKLASNIFPMEGSQLESG